MTKASDGSQPRAAEKRRKPSIFEGLTMAARMREEAKPQPPSTLLTFLFVRMKNWATAILTTARASGHENGAAFDGAKSLPTRYAARAPVAMNTSTKPKLALEKQARPWMPLPQVQPAPSFEPAPTSRPAIPNLTRPRLCNESRSKDASSTRAKKGFDTSAKAPA